MSEPAKAVFLSYASQDAEAAKRICDALRAAGVEVWFDQSELVGGDAWDQKIRGQIKGCAIFMPVISAATQARREGYFRIEWKLAAQRTHAFADGTPFLLPLVIDETRDSEALVPEEFRAVQWTRLRGGETSVAFCARVKRLLSSEVAPISERRFQAEESARAETASGGRAETARRTPAPSRKRFPIWATGIVVILLAVAAALFVRLPFPHPKPEIQNSTSAPVSPPAPLSEARQLVAKARSFFDALESTRDHYRLAEELMAQAKAKDATDAEVCAAEAQLHQRFIQRNWDTSDARREAARAATQDAIGLDPQSFEARFAVANSLGNTERESEDKERQLQALRRERPSEQRVLRALASVMDRQGRLDEAFAIDAESASLPGGDPLALYNQSVSCWFSGRTAEAEIAMQASLAQQPFTGALLMSAWYRIALHGDLDGARALLNRIAPTQMVEDRAAFFAYYVELLARQPDAAIARLKAVPRDWLEDGWFRGPKSQLIGDALQVAGRGEAAAVEWRVALGVVERRLATNSSAVNLHFRRCSLLATLGRREAAEREFALLLELAGIDLAAPKPVPVWVTQCCVLLGRKTEAIQQLALGLKQPRHAVDYTAAVLRLDPGWEPLRGEPEFAPLIAAAEASERPPVPVAKAGAMELHPPVASPKSVAVLAFANLSDDRANEYFSDGISEELLNVLAKVPGLKVTARTSSFHFKGKDTPIPEIARQLGVAYVVEGSVRKQGDKVRITAQLIKAADGFHVWSDTFTRDLKDIFAVQDEIAGLIAQNLQLKLGVTAAPRAVNPEAYVLLLQGREIFNRGAPGAYPTALKYYRDALALDPDSAPTWAALAVGYAASSAQGAIAVESGNALARDAAARALALDPDSAKAHYAMGFVHFVVDWDWTKARAEYERVLAGAPNDVSALSGLATVEQTVGEAERALELSRRAVELDPLGFIPAYSLGKSLFQTRRFAELQRHAERMIAVNPGGRYGYLYLTFVHLLEGRIDEAAKAFEPMKPDLFRDLCVALVRHAQHRTAEAGAVIAGMEAKYSDGGSYQIAEAYAYLGQVDRAFEWLEQGYRARDAGLTWMNYDQFLDKLHADPRWAALQKKMNLLPASRK